jgi:hypothetical protein
VNNNKKYTSYALTSVLNLGSNTSESAGIHTYNAASIITDTGKLPQTFLKTHFSINTGIIIHKIITMAHAWNSELTVQPGVQ